jgi:hypothetical protein
MGGPIGIFAVMVRLFQLICCGSKFAQKCDSAQTNPLKITQLTPVLATIFKAPTYAPPFVVGGYVASH